MALLVLLGAITTTRAQMPFPREPEEDNEEYLLDLAVNEYSRLWREAWDAGDNRFRLRAGSNNMAQWFLEEELKAAAVLTGRLRFRFYHARLLRHSAEKLGTDTFEFEGRVVGDWFLSAHGTPTSEKAENNIGIRVQNRRSVNRYTVVFVEWPQLVRNFAEHGKDNSDSLIVVFADHPIRLGVNSRERLAAGLWLRVQGELIPEFEVAEEIQATGVTARTEKVEARSLAGWLEFGWDRIDEAGDKEAPTDVAGPPGVGVFETRSAVGIDTGYRLDKRAGRRSAGLGAGGGQPVRMAGQVGGQPFGLCALGGRPVSGRLVSPVFGAVRRESGDEPHPTLPVGDVPLMEFDRDLYIISDDDSIVAWTNRRLYARPYGWVAVGERWTVRGSVQLETRDIRRLNRQDTETTITKRIVVPIAGVRWGLGARQASVVEFGWASQFRHREEEVRRGGDVSSSSMNFDDHRIYVAFEYAFGPARMLRLIETIDLDNDERGRFGVHDHGFFQLLFGF